MKSAREEECGNMCVKLRGGGGGGGGGVYPRFFVKLLFEMAVQTTVDRQTRNHDQTFEGVPNPN